MVKEQSIIAIIISNSLKMHPAIQNCEQRQIRTDDVAIQL